LILHGRNEEKTRKVAEEIKASGGGRDVRFFLADVTSSGHDFKKMVEGFKDLNITLLFNNVGGTTVKPAK
jgi:17beta-estradiol 17-dehydrogenase / very-long-chain 3-oxoacyl-CoA reductase